MFRACARLFPGRHPSDVVRYLRIGEGLTLAEVAERLGVCESTVSEWQPEECRYMQLVTPAARAARRRNALHMLEVNRQRDHWRRHRWARKWQNG